MKVNPNMMKMMQSMMNSGNPQQAVLSMLEGQVGNGNPMIANLFQLAKNGNTAGIEQIARNMMKEQGRDFDREFSEFKNNLGIK